MCNALRLNQAHTALTSAPSFINNSTISLLPFSAAECNAVVPKVLATLTQAPADIKDSTLLLLSFLTASSNILLALAPASINNLAIFV